LEGGSEIFIKYYQPYWAVYGEVGQSTNRAHNLILDILLNVGFYGLILFILLYYFFFSLAKDNFGKKRQPALSLALALGAAAYLFSLLFSFAIVAGEFYFWLFLALLAAINSGSDETRDGEGTSLSVKIGYPLKIIIAVGLIFLTFWRLDATFKSLKADYYFKNIYSALAEPDYPAALFLDAVLRTQKANPANQASYDRLLTEKLSGLYPLIENAEIKKAVQGKLAAVAANLPDSGYENLLVKAKAANTLGKYYEARAYLNRIITLAPYWPLVYLEQGKLAANQGDDKGALVAYNLALLNLPDAGDSRLNGSHLELVRHYQYLIYYRIGDIYGQESNYAAAEKYYRSAYQSDPDDFVLLKKIADMNYRRGDFKTALEYTAHGLARNPRDYKWSVALATLYYESGDKQSARKYLDQALKLAPDNREILDLKKTYGQ
jgi:tetratricopeptide (TPR) repeat protein